MCEKKKPSTGGREKKIEGENPDRSSFKFFSMLNTINKIDEETMNTIHCYYYYIACNYYDGEYKGK